LGIFSTASISTYPDFSVFINRQEFSGSKKIAFKNSKAADVAEFLTTIAGQKLVYFIATPITYTLTAPQVRTLLGVNNVLADTGDINKLVYPADTKLFIEKLTKPTEDNMIANNNIPSGKFFMVGNSLYLSTQAIAQGAAITPGTNCTAISLAEALNTINQ
jgi:hypothetical protein